MRAQHFLAQENIILNIEVQEIQRMAQDEVTATEQQSSSRDVSSKAKIS